MYSPEVYFSKVYFCKMYLTFVSSEHCVFFENNIVVIAQYTFSKSSLFYLLQVFGGEFVSGVDEMKTYVSLGGKVSTSCL